MSGSYRILLGVVELIKGKNKNQKDLRIYGRWIRRFGVVSVVGLVTLLVFTVAPVIRHSDNAEGVACAPEPCGVDPAGTVTSGLKTATSVLAITTGRPSADVDLNPTPEGTFVMSDSAHSANFGAYTNNLTGYTLTVAAADDSRQLKNTIGENVVGTLDSISSAVSASTFQNSASYNGKWGYKPSKINSTNNDSFLQVPTTTIQTLNETSCANGTPSCPNQVDEYSIAIAARSDYTKPYGTYTNTLILNMVTNPINYTVHFKDNSGDTVTDIPADINVSSASAINVQLSNRLPSRTNYTFRSWCDGEVTDGGTTCNGTEYPANSVYPLSQSESTYIELTALWYLSMQDMTYSQCTEKPKLAVDNRDGQKYIVKKMADGRCWMLDNLNLGATDISVTLDRSNSNFSSRSVDAATFNGWRKTAATAGTYVDGVMYHVEGTDPVSKNAYGMLYNYYAATGGYTEGSANIVSADYDICPKGWRMPTGGAAKGELPALFATFGSTAALQYAGMRAPVSEGGAAFALTGNMAANALPTAAGTTISDYWAVTDSTNSGDTNYQNAYRVGLRIPASSAAPSNVNIARNTGHPIRCILRPTIENLKYLDEFHLKATGIKYESAEDRKSIIKSMKDNTEYVLRDRRDEQEYTVAKLKDGRVWMTKNLNLGATPITVAIAAATTAVASNTNSAAAITVANYNSYKKTAFTPTYTAAEYVPVEGYDTTAKQPYGTLYNYMIASATTIKVTSQQADAVNDICPAGWRLPTGESFGEFATLYSAYSSSGTDMRKSVAEGGAALALAGTAIGTGQGSTGYYWTSTRDTNTGTLAMRLSGSSVSLNQTLDRGQGGSIRCILKTDIGDFDNMQDFKNMNRQQRADVVGYMLDRFNYTLKDTRDNTYYTVTKYNDGTVWMSQDLKLTSLSGLNSDNTNITTSKSLSPTVISSTSTSTYSSYTSPQIVRSTGAIDATSKTEYGALYNYYAASAGTVSGSSNSTDTLQDICPAGWRLPVGTATGEFKTLSANANYKTLALMKTPVYSLGGGFSLTGTYSAGMQNQGTSVFYWTSSADGSDTTRSGMALGTALTVASTADRASFNPIRCTLKFTADTMQDFNLSTFTANQKTGLKYSMFPQTNYTLLDNRDHQSYTVAKLKDGRVWMTENLNLGRYDFETDLIAANTHLSTAVTAAVFNGWYVDAGTRSYTVPQFAYAGSLQGVLYNYAAASANTIKAASVTSNGTYDICPAAWRIPTGNTTGEFKILADAYGGSSSMMRATVSGGGAALVKDGSFDDYGAGTNYNSWGSYWASTRYNNTEYYSLYISNSEVNPVSNSFRYYGHSIRCILI